MPFTLSHPAAVLLVRRTGLPVAAMVGGSMTPDAPLFLPSHEYGATHSLHGILTVDLVISIVLVVVWVVVVRDALVDLAPQGVRRRLSPTVRYSPRQWALVPVGAVLGSSTHVVWDAFTHPGRWGVRRVVWLHTEHLGMSGSQWAQFASGGLGLLVVLAWMAHTIRTARPGVDGPSRPSRTPRLARVALPVVVGAASWGTVLGALSRTHHGLHHSAYGAAVHGTVLLALAVLVVSLAWQVAVRWTGSRPRPSLPAGRR